MLNELAWERVLALLAMLSNYPGYFILKTGVELVTPMSFCCAQWACFFLNLRLSQYRLQQAVKCTSSLEQPLIHWEPPSALPADTNEQRTQPVSVPRSIKDGESVWASHGRECLCRHVGSQRGCQGHHLLLVRDDKWTQSEPCLSDFEYLDSKCPYLQLGNYQSTRNTTQGPRNRSWFADCTWHEKFTGASWLCIAQPLHILFPERHVSGSEAEFRGFSGMLGLLQFVSLRRVGEPSLCGAHL